uniref:ATP-dependent Clp protease proteolytic subunit n=1 Tax=Macropsychanthus marginatus TaxID=1457467 RepID=UPI00220C0FDA|nr:ATP-dependent Clp protease proteolytic subunit [Macropsychanthus marginatus]UXL85146.1 ATP-dependent Clp protease proteolytic subunit [Macropsychanthus marginatus]
MPVGIPKIPFRFPDEEDASWVELYFLLSRLRVLFICKRVDPEVSNQICGTLAFLNMEDEIKDIFVFVQCMGGGVVSGLSIFDMITTSVSPVYTIAMGNSAAMGAFILSGGDITKRLAFPHARVMIHQPTSSFREGHPVAYFLDMNEMKRVRDDIVNTYKRRTGQSYQAILTGMERKNFMSAEEAKAFGIIDEIVDRESKLENKVFIPNF